MTWFANIAAQLRRRRAILAGVLLVLIILLFPFKMTVVPRWRLRVVDEQGTPVRTIRVTEHWQHYLVESDGHEEALETDDGGRVDFPERTVRASFTYRLLATLSRFTKMGSPVKSGPYCSIVVWGRREYLTAVAAYQPDTPLTTEVVVLRQR